MAKITPVLWKARINSEGQSPIYIRIEANNQRRYTSLKVYIKPRHWNADKGRVRKSHRRYESINDLIQTKVNEAEQSVLNLRVTGEDVTPSSVKKSIRPAKQSEIDFIAFGSEYVDELRRNGKVSTAHRYESILRKIRRYHGPNLYFKDVNNAFLLDYQAFMVKDLGNAQSTRAANFRAVRTMVNKAARRGLIEPDKQLFEGISFHEPGGAKRKLQAHEIEAIRAIDLEVDSPQWRSRSYWLVAMYLGGMRFRDVADLRVSAIQDGRLNYKMSKTAKHKNIDIPPAAQAIIDHYLSADASSSDRVFPILNGYNTSDPELMRRAVSSQNAYINRLLKEVAKLAGVFAGLSFHQSRHSFANMAIEAGWSVRKIQGALGHKDIETTERYLRALDAELAGNEMGKLFGGQND